MRYVVAMSVLLAFCSIITAEEPFVSAEGGYSVEFPTGWTTKKSGEEVRATSPSSDVVVKVEWTKLANGVTVDKYVNLTLDSFKKSLNEFNKIGSGVMATPANSEVRWTRFSFKDDKDNLTMTFYLLFNMNGRRLYVISCQTKSDAHEAKIPDFDKIVQSFRFQ